MAGNDSHYLKRNRVERSHFDLLHHFYGQHHREVMAYAMFFTKNNEDDSVDTLQDTFCAALESLQKGTEIDNPRAWLLKIARNNMLRRRERQVLETTSWQKYAEVNPLSENFAPKVLNNVLAESITEYIIRECTPDEQEIFALRHFHEMNLADISEVVEQPLSNVHRVLDTITERVEKRYSNLTG